MIFSRLRGLLGGQGAGNLVCFVESYNEFDTYAGLVDRLCREHGWSPHFVGQLNYDPGCHHLAPFFRRTHGARFSNVVDWALWSEASNPRKAVYSTFVEVEGKPFQKLMKKRWRELSERGADFLLRHLKPTVAFASDRCTTLVERDYRPEKTLLHQPGITAEACHAHGVPLIAVLPGSNMFVNDDNFDAGEARETVPRIFFTDGAVPVAAKALFVSTDIDQSRHRDSMAPDRIHVMGSLRYNPEWMARLMEEALPLAEGDGGEMPVRQPGKTHVLMIMTPVKYHVDRDRLRDAVLALARHPEVELVIKPHTRRANSDGIGPEDMVGEAVQFLPNPPTARLVDWSDICITYGSTTCLQALMRGKPLVDPVLFHGNRLLPKEYGACWAPGTVEELVEGIVREASTPLSPERLEGREALKRRAIHADRPEAFDVLGEAVEVVEQIRARTARELGKRA